jgi:GntR family transcriptional regulator / MocR family aminotransferase
MERERAIASLDLHVDLSGNGVRSGLMNALREAVRTGRLVAGVRLPSSRALAGDLGIARNTVAEAYGQLVAEGWLVARQGSGTRVAEGMVSEPEPTSPRDRPEQPRYDLRPGTPDVSMFPRTAWLQASRRALTSAPNEAFGYGDPRGRIELRRMLADYLARARGVRADPERMLICSGYAQGLSVLTDALRSNGAKTMAVEEYGFGFHRDVVRRHGLGVVPVPVDEEGARADLLTGEAALLTPAHQMPVGVPLAPRRRAAAIDWARAADAVLIEDDYDGEFRYDRQPVGALQGLDPERVVYTGTASKSLAPGLRLAWMVLPRSLVEPVVEAKRLVDLHTATFEQLALAEFIASGNYDRHVRRCRLHYRRRRDRLVAALAERAPGVRVTGIAAGLQALLAVPRDADDINDIVARAAAHGLAVSTLDEYRFAPDPDAHQALIVGYGTPPEHAYSGALEILCRVLAGGW